MLDYTGCDAIMIGRGVLGNPWLIREIDTYLKSDYYDKYLISTEDISKNIKDVFGINEKKLNHTILFVHLPIYDKKDLIKMVIEKAESVLEDITNGKVSI